MKIADQDGGREPARSRTLGRPRGHVAIEDRLDEITETATRLFRERGFRGTRLDDIAAALGVTRAALYYYFEGKEQILELVCERAMTAGEEALAESVEGGDPIESLRSFAHRFARIMTSDQARVFFRERSELRDEFRQALMKRTRRLTRGAREIVDAGIAAGELRPVEDPELAAIGLLSMINSMSQWFQPSGPLSAAQVVDAYLDIYLRGLAMPSSVGAGAKKAK